MFFCLTAGPAAAFAQTSQPAMRTIPKLELAIAAIADDVAGVRLGMSDSEAKENIIKQGFNLRETVKGPSWYELVTNPPRSRSNARFHHNRAVKSMSFTGPDRQEVTVFFVQFPTGAIVSRVIYRFSARMSVENLSAALRVKYRPPTCAENWCALSVVENRDPDSVDMPRLTANAVSRTIELQGGSQFENASNWSVNKAIKRDALEQLR